MVEWIEMMVYVAISLQILTLIVMVMLLAGLRYLGSQILPLVQQARGLLGSDGIGGLLQAVKGTKPMDLIALGAMQILPQVAPGIAGFLNQKMAQMAAQPPAPPSAMGAAPPVLPLRE